MPVEETKETKDTPPPVIEPERPPSHSKAIIALLIVAIILGVGGYLFWRYSETYESTDDAEVDGHLISVSSRIQGTVTAVHGDQDQYVKTGQVMVTIDPSDFQVAAEQARAELAQAQAGIQVENPNVPITMTSSETAVATNQADVANAVAAVAAAERDMAAAEARLRETEANNVKAQGDVVRYRALVDKDEVAREQYDTIVAAAQAQAAAVDSARASAGASQKVVDQRRAQLAQAESRLKQASSNAPRQVAASRATVRLRQASAESAQARLDRALLNLSYTQVPAPVDGVIGKRSVEVGSTVQPGQQLFNIAQISDLWVTANFKETQLRRMHPGERVDISVDAFAQKFHGYVESMPASTGAILSLLPPENATGNYVKVVQRLPVRIRFDKDQKGLERLRPGMSVEPKVWLQ